MHMRVPSIEKHKNYRRLSAVLSKEFLQGSEKQINELKLKQAVKKQTDRRNKLKKLLEIFLGIQQSEKKNSRLIKCSMIQLKDSPIIMKPKIQIQPTIFTSNNLKPEYREFLSTLLNTFYSSYVKSDQKRNEMAKITEQLTFMIKDLSVKEDKIFYLHNSSINNSTIRENTLQQLGQELKKQITQKQKTKETFDSIYSVYSKQAQYNQEKQSRVTFLRQYFEEIKLKINETDSKIVEQEVLKKQLWDQFLEETMYEKKIGSVLINVQNEIKIKSKQVKKGINDLVDLRVNKSQKKLDDSFKGMKVNKNQNCIHLMKPTNFKQSKEQLNRNGLRSLVVGESEKSRIKFTTNQEFSQKNKLL